MFVPHANGHELALAVVVEAVIEDDAVRGRGLDRHLQREIGEHRGAQTRVLEVRRTVKERHLRQCERGTLV